ncbi:bifunctional diaminohydroxyphosphoribosylaminopyrimidine deaminase/5-amino-6-(5-phosphoribosylamino)uracil reductase RibD [Clostridium sp. MB40-C1]|uniref:bifunctional diaminohydroxyphosphoribosylaminopyrimidine deaminase/5-amino-6-(5-phosphoribosylamino)uracil reductase RibD n=1 Tax=Clostridium sp. MB40-C1 TaxID=3070996 RepID=UPI0027DF7B92|nr:bifunctional diaminohydroxyphosphoribosylaminopyrimidine deaminase/5-amino-6-(5-phosphoribosylamino)uracil reductase RibD [Clostridium sp. MB40-C1]WMJ79929.1 bifunctional diaminohydroxyphosphoribosylaminopyrimidine deaminase/5-amino-6-(5-phosphoribosylamino)uracil reductase RibD [Clostridium sp. MB40-C1]
MDKKYMKKAIELAKKGEGFTKPNPLVGAVIVKNNRIIGEGYHQYYGGPHAEINAFKNAVEDVKGAKMYVTLEPCSHYGKTPPCAKAIVENGIKEVVIGMKDPNPLVAGKGINILKKNGIKVTCGVLEDEVKEINDIFIKYITTKKPFCIMKTAMTMDGKIAAYTGDSKWITNDLSRQYVHKIRNRVSAIMVGIGTVIADNPRLTTRIEDKIGSDPIRVIVDSKGRIPLEAEVLNIDSNAKTIIVVTDKADKEKIDTIKRKGAEIIVTPENNGRVDLAYLMDELGRRDIDSVLLEGGSTLNFSALNEKIVDKVITFIAPKLIGGENSKTPVGGEGIAYMKDAIKLHNIKINTFGEDVMIEGKIIYQ